MYKRQIPYDLPRVDFFHWVAVDIPSAVTQVEVGAGSDSVVPKGKPGPAAFHGARHGVNDYTAWFTGDPDMGGDYFGYKGEFYDIPELKLCPVPTKPVPILIGGHSNLALKRAARVGDGWISAGLSLEETEELINKINNFREEFGTLDHPNYQFQVMGEAAYSLSLIHI